MRKFSSTIIASMIIASQFAIAAPNSVPSGWFKSGSNMTDYKLGTDTFTSMHGNRSAFIESVKENPEGFSTMMQMADASPYLGKRVRMTVEIRSENIADWAGAWLRIDGESAKMLGFDNMQDRSIKGTTEWQSYEVVLDVPENSKVMAYGVLLNGAGKVWFDNFNFEVVDSSISLTGGEIK